MVYFFEFILKLICHEYYVCNVYACDNINMHVIITYRVGVPIHVKLLLHEFTCIIII